MIIAREERYTGEVAATPCLDLATVELADLEDFIVSRGHPRFHARQIYRWVWRRGVTDLAGMTDLPRTLRADLAGVTTIATPSGVHSRPP